MRIGIMQGRLLPPVGEFIQRFPKDGWAEEFPLAERAGLSAIEWIYEVYGADENPIASDAGIARMEELSRRHTVEVKSVCADYFMDRPFLRTTQAERDARLELLRWLVARCAALNVDRIILPFVDASRIETPDDVSTVVSLLSRVMEEADAAGVELHLETSLPPDRFAELLARLPHPRVKANYDSGNSASLGYDVTEEFRAYGARIGSVHIKDRIRGGSTVPLGRGDVDFDALFEGLGEIGYTREFILQVARSAAGDELEWAKRNRAFVEERCAALRR